MRADDQRGIPIPPGRIFSLSYLWLDGCDFPALPVVTDKHAILRNAVDDVRILGVDSRLEAVAAGDNEPIAVANPVDVVGARGAALSTVVLSAAVDVVEREAVVDSDSVELCDRQVGLVVVVLASVPGFIKPAVATEEQVIRAVREESHCVVVDVLPALSQAVERLTAVFAYLDIKIHRVDTVQLIRIGIDFLEVHRVCAHVTALLVPALALVFGTEEAACFTFRFDQSIDDIRINGRNSQ